MHEFVGDSVVLPVSADRGSVRFEGMPIAIDAQGLPDGNAAVLCARPYDIAVHSEAAGGQLTDEVKRVRASARFLPS